MSKHKIIYACEQCGATHSKWQGQCTGCNAWNTLIESREIGAQTITASRFVALAETAQVQSLACVDTEEKIRISTGQAELDRVLGGGIVAGAVILLGGDPGIGKSTLLLQALSDLSKKLRVLYVSGEESAEQIALRAKRLKVFCDQVSIFTEIRLTSILSVINTEKPKIAVIDSIQTIYSDLLQSAPGSVAQVRECAAQLTRYAKQSGTALFVVGHVTKEGALAGPRVLEHIVDTVLYFEGDTHSSYRLIRAIKNRFGAVNELGVFAMAETGLRGISNPSALFLNQYSKAVPGSCVLVTQEGSRILLVEVQALVDETHAPNPRRLAVGLEQNRLALLLAVLHRHARIACFNQDVFINAVGGVRISEPAADLAILMAIVSSLIDRPLPTKMVVFGELGLTGEVRPVQRGQERLKEAARLGFTHAIIPKANAPKSKIGGMEIFAVEHLSDAVQYCR